MVLAEVQRVNSTARAMDQGVAQRRGKGVVAALDGDGFGVNIQTEISSTIAHDRLLRCGSAFCVSYQARA
jgi:hypothetical protein